MTVSLSQYQGDARRSLRGVPSEVLACDNSTAERSRVELAIKFVREDTICGRPTGTTSFEWMTANLTSDEARETARLLVESANQADRGASADREIWDQTIGEKVVDRG